MYGIKKDIKKTEKKVNIIVKKIEFFSPNFSSKKCAFLALYAEAKFKMNEIIPIKVIGIKINSKYFEERLSIIDIVEPIKKVKKARYFR